MPDGNDLPHVPEPVRDHEYQDQTERMERAADDLAVALGPFDPVEVVHARRYGKRVPEMHVHNIGDQVRAWAEKAIIRVAHGERYGWDASLVMVPQPAPTGFQIMSMYAIIVYAPNAILNQPPLGAVRMISDNPSEDQTAEAIASAVEELRQERSKGLIMRPPVSDLGIKRRPVKDHPQA